MIDTNKQYTFDAAMQMAEKNEADLELIHQFADKSTTLDDFAILEMTAINDRPVLKDGLRLIVSAEWQAAHVDDYAGLPLTSDHSSSRDKKLGRLFAAQIMNEDGTTSTHIKAFIAKGIGNDDDIEAIRKGRDREVSLGFRFSQFKEVEIDGIPHIRILPGNDDIDGPREVSLVGLPAATNVGIHSIAASADKPIEAILHDNTLSAMDRECLLYGRMQHATLIDDVISYERQLGIVNDVKLAKDACEHLSPFHLQDRRDSLLNTLKKNEKTDTQCSVDVDAMLSDSFGEERIPNTEDDKALRIKQILETIRS